jgi:hypothetical protein
MKIKFDYVTNSSSTSFTGYGIKLKFVPERLWHLLYDYAKNNKEHNYHMIESDSFEEFVLGGPMIEVFQDFLNDYHLDIRYCSESNEWFIGLYSHETYDARTGKRIVEKHDEDIEKIKSIFKSLFLETAIVDFSEFNNKIEFIDEEWYS